MCTRNSLNRQALLANDALSIVLDKLLVVCWSIQFHWLTKSVNRQCPGWHLGSNVDSCRRNAVIGEWFGQSRDYTDGWRGIWGLNSFSRFFATFNILRIGHPPQQQSLMSRNCVALSTHRTRVARSGKNWSRLSRMCHLVMNREWMRWLRCVCLCCKTRTVLRNCALHYSS